MELNQIKEDEIKAHRILTIIYSYCKFKNTNTLETEVLLHKYEFWTRNPDHFSLSLLTEMEKENFNKEDVKTVIKELISAKEPECIINPMIKYKFGAYEKLDNALSFLKMYGLIEIPVIKTNTISNKRVKNEYVLTSKGESYIEHLISDKNEFILWCKKITDFILKFYASKIPTDIKEIQYGIKEYKEALFNTRISSVLDKLKVEFNKIYNEELEIYE